MVYLTHARLMRESEDSVAGCALSGEGLEQRICSELIASPPRYTTWFAGHDRRMGRVADGRRRERQITALRLVATEQVHRAALVRHLRDDAITGRARDRLLAEFYGSLDSVCAALAEHRAYTQAVSSEICAVDLLELAGDRFGVQLVEQYRRDYGIFFAMHCDRALALADGRPYLLASLLPEVRTSASHLRRRLLSGEKLPVRQLGLAPAPGARAARTAALRPAARASLPVLPAPRARAAAANPRRSVPLQPQA